jgi:hypothetical protein
MGWLGRRERHLNDRLPRTQLLLHSSWIQPEPISTAGAQKGLLNEQQRKSRPNIGARMKKENDRPGPMSAATAAWSTFTSLVDSTAAKSYSRIGKSVKRCLNEERERVAVLQRPAGRKASKRTLASASAFQIMGILAIDVNGTLSVVVEGEAGFKVS